MHHNARKRKDRLEAKASDSSRRKLAQNKARLWHFSTLAQGVALLGGVALYHCEGRALGSAQCETPQSLFLAALE